MKPGRVQNRISAREDTSLSLPKHEKPRPARGFLCLTGSSSLTGGWRDHMFLTVVGAGLLRGWRSHGVIWGAELLACRRGRALRVSGGLSSARVYLGCGTA